MILLRKKTSYLVACCLLLVACTSIDLFEKSVTIPGHKWGSNFKPSFTFTIKDSTTPYQVYLVLRHNEKYNFNNIYVNLYTKLEGPDSAQKFTVDVPLADKENWRGTGMDDIYEHREPLGAAQTFKPGTYTFTLEQIMREDPLENVLNAGIRLEAKK